MSAKVMQVIQVYETRGKGIASDPARTVVVYYDFDGNKLAEYDPCAEVADARS